MSISTRNHKASISRLVMAGLLATAGFGAMAQSAPTPPAAPPQAAAPMSRDTGPGMQGHHMGRYDPAKMQARMAKRQGEFKAKLNITPAQEPAWNAYTAAMQPPARMGGRWAPEQRAQFDKMTTPERIDKMREMRTQRMAEMNAAMDKRGDATKALYAALSPEQQKTFDAEYKNRREHMRDHMRDHAGHHGGNGARQPARGGIDGQKS